MSYLNEDLDLLAKEIHSLGFCNCSVLVTGATGLIGGLLVKAFLRANERFDTRITVKAVCRSQDKADTVFSSYLNNQYLLFVYQDVISQFDEHAKADYIVHTASPTTSKYFMTNPVETIDAIFQGTKNVLELAKKSSAKGVVYLSSMEVFGQVEHCDARLREEQLGYVDIANIRSCYSEGKRMAECLCKCYAEEYQLPVRIARLAQVFGAGVSKTENRVFAQFARSAVKGEDIVLHTKGESFGNYCYARDAVKGILLLLKQGSSGEVYSIVNEETTMSIADMAKLVAKHFSNGQSRVIFDIPKNNVYGYAPVTKMRLSAEKISALGWKPEVGLVEAYTRMIPDLN